MSVYIITGKLGSGKSIAAVGKIREYLQQGRRVATNLDLYLEQLLPAKSKQTVVRIPDKPRLQDLENLGTGSGLPVDDYDESKFGLLVLDELGSWFNARTWNDKSRQELIDWFIHARKYHWDILLLVQDVENIDKQLRNSLCEHLVVCRRLDRVGIPFISFIIKTFTGVRVTLPKIHVASVYYGENRQALRVDRWLYRGSDLYKAYRTGQVFSFDEKWIHGQMVDMRASYSMLSAWHLKGRYLPPMGQRIRQFLLSVANAGLRFIVRLILAGSRPRSGRAPAAHSRDGSHLSRLERDHYTGQIDRTQPVIWRHTLPN